MLFAGLESIEEVTDLSNELLIEELSDIMKLSADIEADSSFIDKWEDELETLFDVVDSINNRTMTHNKYQLLNNDITEALNISGLDQSGFSNLLEASNETLYETWAKIRDKITGVITAFRNKATLFFTKLRNVDVKYAANINDIIKSLSGKTTNENELGLRMYKGVDYKDLISLADNINKFNNTIKPVDKSTDLKTYNTILQNIGYALIVDVTDEYGNASYNVKPFELDTKHYKAKLSEHNYNSSNIDKLLTMSHKLLLSQKATYEIIYKSYGNLSAVSKDIDIAVSQKDWETAKKVKYNYYKLRRNLRAMFQILKFEHITNIRFAGRALALGNLKAKSSK